MQESTGLNIGPSIRSYAPGSKYIEGQDREDEMKELKEKFIVATDWREEHYNDVIRRLAADEKTKEALNNKKDALNTHNDIVFDYAHELSKELDLSDEEKVAVLIGVILHDSGKLEVDDLEHHLKGMELARKFFSGLSANQKFNGITITPEIKEMVINSIECHMNHPYLIWRNKGDRFPEAKTNVAKAVADADMLANIGFKNVALRVCIPSLFNEDVLAAKDGKFLTQAFRNVVEGDKFGAIKLDQTVLTEPAINRAKELIGNLQEIYKDLIDNGALDELQEKYYKEVDGKVYISSAAKLKKELNEKIQDTGKNLESIRKYWINL